MWILLGAIAIAIFLFGLVQWAYSGAGLWSVWSLKKGLRFASCREWAEKEDEIRRTEKRTNQSQRLARPLRGLPPRRHH